MDRPPLRPAPQRGQRTWSKARQVFVIIGYTPVPFCQLRIYRMPAPQDQANSGPVADALYFLGRFLRNPRRVASVLPSSRFLTHAMFEGLALRDGDVVVEFGPGTGAFTQEIRRLRKSGVNIRYLGIERDAGLYRRLCARFPELDFQLGDVRDAATFVAERGLPPVRIVLSGLPLLWMPDDLVESIFAGLRVFMRRDGEFRTFSYVHNYPMPGAIKLRARLSRAFGSYHLSRPVLRNVPPAFVLSCTKPACTES